MQPCTTQPGTTWFHTPRSGRAASGTAAYRDRTGSAFRKVRRAVLLSTAAFAAGGGDYRAPAQRAEDFLHDRASRALGDVTPTYRPGVTMADLRAVLPAYAAAGLKGGIQIFARQLRGFDHPDAVLTGVEARSSSPLRIPRDEGLQSNVRGLYPAGEGAGFAGGIMSAAVDGLRIAQAVAERI